MNTTTKWGETNGFTATDFTRTLLTYLKKNTLNYIICNSTLIEKHLLEKYSEERAAPVVVDHQELQRYAHNVIEEDVITQTDVVRHDAEKISRVLMNLL